MKHLVPAWHTNAMIKHFLTIVYNLCFCWVLYEWNMTTNTYTVYVNAVWCVCRWIELYCAIVLYYNDSILCTSQHLRCHSLSPFSSWLRHHEAWPWWRPQMEPFFTLLALCAGNSLVTGQFPTQRPVTRSFDVLFDLRLNNRLSKQSRGWWFETPSRPLWRHCNGGSNTRNLTRALKCEHIQLWI